MAHADFIIQNARVFTANPAQPQAEAVAVRSNRIVFVGRTADSESLAGPATRRIDGQGSTLLPGFIDSHFHLRLGSLKLGDIDLGSVSSLAELAGAVHKFVAAHPRQSWFKGQGLRYSALPGQTLTRHQLDDIVADRPLLLTSYDGHTAWANTMALRQAGILHNPPTVGPNSLIRCEPDGSAAGELVEPDAFNLVDACLPAPDAARQRELLKQGLARAAAFGLTSVHNMDGDAEQMAVYTEMEAAGELTLRIYVPYHVTPTTPLDALAEAAQMRQNSTPLVRGGAVKFFMDGVIETYTGLLIDDYAGRPGDTGGALFAAEHFTQFATQADRLGLQIFVHAVGDGAVRRALDGFEAARRTNGHRDSRHRVEHIELIHPGDLPRFAQLGVIASMQPAHAPLNAIDPDPWPQRVGPERWACSFAWQTLRLAGARLALGSDWPVASANPFEGLYYALNRQPWQPGLPDQRQSLAEALTSYTADAAFAEFKEQEKGQLRPGLLADLVLLSHNIFAVPPAELRQVQPVLTVSDGRIVFEA
ncbi:MAG: N-substituted formamide deformylase [Anaerolineae bacterium]|nr:N-substituted formamide deformylase [Anaerolineae bacterium]